jgi:hypothetical protein
MFKFLPPTTLPGFRVGLPEDDELAFNVANDGSTPPVPGAPDVPTVDDSYPFGATSPGSVAPQAPSPNPAAPLGIGFPLPPAGHQMPTDPTPSAGSFPLDPQGSGGAFNYARYVPDSPINQADPAAEPPNPIQKASGGTDFSPIGSAQAQTPQSQKPGTSFEIDPSPGEAVVLPDGLTLPTIDSPTGQVMSPVTDLTPVAAAGRQAGLRYRAMLDNPQTALLAPIFLATALGASLGHAGTFDYQRRGNMITGYTQLPQFREVSNINVGIFAQQAGLTLDETLKLAEMFAWGRSNNYRHDQSNGLDDKTAQFITSGFNIGKTGVFGPPVP